ncbi:MAG: hypothetical protein H0W84_00060 [Bacteroidetes bacterium]|nr:hypothetical protein [Bacteroidota bacterium]
MLQTTTYKETPIFFEVDYAKKSVAGKNRINYTTFGAPMDGRTFNTAITPVATIYQSVFLSGSNGWVNNWGPASNTTISTVGGQLQIVANVQSAGAAYIVTTIPGKQYKYTIDIASISNLAPNSLVYFARNASGSDILVQSTQQPGVYSLIFTAQETSTRLCIELNTAGASVMLASAKLELMTDLPYRYGFNGKEKDDEVSGSGNDYNYGFRIYNPRLGRFLSVDPLAKSYPWYTPYQFAGNTPIQAIDLDGAEIYYAHGSLQIPNR